MSAGALVASRGAREELDLVRGRISLLAGADRAMMQMYLENGSSFRQLADLSGASATSVARRIRRLTSRLTDNRYTICLRNRSSLSGLELVIARDYLVRGLPRRRIAQEHALSYYRVGKTVRAILDFVASVGGNAELPKQIGPQTEDRGLKTEETINTEP